ncbi:MAG: CHAT domain-containing protein [Synechococcales bacterium]|nr:CHAT domain-containing protein [Synechococcales bacterium]
MTLSGLLGGVLLPLVIGLPAHATIAANSATTSTPPIASRNLPNSQSLIKQGQLRYQTGNFTVAIELWQKAAQAYQQSGDSLNQALSLSYLSTAQQALGDWQSAKNTLEQAQQLIKAQGKLDTKGVAIAAQINNTQGKLQLSQSQPQLALETWKATEKAYQQIDDRNGVLGSQLNQAQALQVLGLYRQAQDLLDRVNQQSQSQPLSPLSVTTQRSLGQLWQASGHLTQAKTSLQKSLEDAQKLNLKVEQSAILLSLGNTHRGLKESTLALQRYEQAASIAPTLHSRLDAQMNQLSLLVETKQWSQAERLLNQISSPLAELAPSRRTVNLGINLATTLMAPQWAEATIAKPTPTQIAAILSNAVKQARQLGDARAESAAIGQLGTLYERNQQWEESKQFTHQALKIAQQINAADLAYRWQWQMGRLHQQQGDRPQAITAYSESIKLLQTLRRDLVAMNVDIQFAFQEKVEPVYRELVQLLVQQDPSQAELAQAREVLEALQQAELEDFFRVACLNSQSIQIDQIDRSAAVFYPIILPDRLVVILSAPGQPLRYYSKEIPHKQLDSLLDQVLESFNPLYSNEERLQLSGQLYDWLVRPAESTIAATKANTLVFVLDGKLRNIPMSALHDGKQYLVEKHNVAIAPGLHLLESQSAAKLRQEKVFVGGLTEARQGFSPLPGVGEETTSITQKTAASIYLNDAFTANNLQQRIRSNNYPVVHLATHGQFSSSVENTFLLTWDKRVKIEDLRGMLLNQSEIGQKPVELLILSACETAAGDSRAILGLAGLAVRSGARSTVATLWSVHDTSTANLMVEFYQGLTQQGLMKATALREAQLKLLRSDQYSHPYYWAPFVLIGNWQ